MLANNSPVNLAVNLNAPVLLVHGEKDRVVDIRQSKKMAKVFYDQFNYISIPLGDKTDAFMKELKNALPN